MNLGIIGFGNMASSIVIGNKEKFNKENLSLYILDENFKKEAATLLAYKNCESNIEVVKNSDIILLAVKPQYMFEVLKEIKPYAKDKAFISIAAGLKQEKIQAVLSESRVLRVLPNLACKVKKSITIFTEKNNLKNEELHFAKNLFENVGTIVTLKEELMSVGGSLGGCTPAFLAIFVESLIDGAVVKGLPRNEATKIAIESLLGSLEYLKELDILPADLKGRVCSPGGTTIAGVAALEENNFRYATMQSIIAATERTDELDKASK